MKELPIYNEESGYKATSTTKYTHLFELELARLKVMQDAAIGATNLVVDDIDKCFIGQILVFIPDSHLALPTTPSKSYIPEFVEVTEISLILNQITINTPISKALAYGDYLYETLYDETEYPSVWASGTEYQYYLQLWHSAFGTLCGRMLFTDFDVPVIAKLSDGILGSRHDNYGVYVPWPIDYKGTSYDTQGRMSNVEVTAANIDQRFSNIILTHEALRKRKVKIYTLYLDNALEANLNVPIRITGDTSVVAGRTDQWKSSISGANAPFNTVIYDAEDEKIQEFEGIIDNVTMNSESVTLTILNYLDSSDDVMIPKMLYTRGRCQFVYKGPRCRFISNLKLYTTATDSDTSILVYDGEGKFPLMEMKDGETHVIQIGQEQMLVTSVSATALTTAMAQEIYHNTSILQWIGFIASNKARFAYKLAVTRGYGSTTQAAYLSETPIDILLCRKTFHDCRLHYHERMFGGFPSVPKQQYNV